MLAWGVRRRKQAMVGAIIVANSAVIILAFNFIVVSRTDASGRLTSFSAESFVSASAGSFSNKVCAASGATATRIFVPSGLQSDNSAADNTGALQRAINRATAAGGGGAYF
jgi:hypothetical protein